MLQWGSIPYDEALHSFGFKATPRVAARLRAELAKGDVTLHVDIETTFHRRPNRTLIVEIPGRVASRRSASCWPRTCRSRARTTTPAAAARCWPRRSRCRTPFAAARCRRRRARSRFSGSTRSAAASSGSRTIADQVKGVVAMLSLDMTGEDTAKTGGTFLIEKEPDPSAMWERPSDPHSEWGAGKVDPATGARQLPERSAPRGGAAAGARHATGSCAPIPTKAAAITPCSCAPACRRCSTGTSPIATTTPISTRIDKVSAAGDAARGDRRRHDGAVPRARRTRPTRRR